MTRRIVVSHRIQNTVVATHPNVSQSWTDSPRGIPETIPLQPGLSTVQALLISKEIVGSHA